MEDIDSVIEGLKKVWNAFNGMEHELYADYVFDALVMLRNYKIHLQNELASLNDQVLQIENGINHSNAFKHLNARSVKWG